MALTAGQYTKATDGTHIETDGIKRYVALLTQSSMDAPVATVLENTLGGTVVWSRNGVGDYAAELTGAFTLNKTALLLGSIDSAGIAQLTQSNANQLSLVTFIKGDDLPESWFNADALLTGTLVDVRVYP